MMDSSAFQFLAVDTIHESTTNPRKTFDEAKLYELAESIRQHGLIQPITVRPNNQGFEIVAGARRFRAAQLAELFSVPARIVEITDAQAIEWQLVENSQRADVHPYEEAQGLQRLLDMRRYDVATLAEKCGKSASHIYARLSLLQLIPDVAEAFLGERITVSHANLIARLSREAQAQAFAHCWRKDWSDTETDLLPAKFLLSWIQNNLYLALADAPFDREDATLNPVAGACATCPRRSGYNTALFADVLSDECLDGDCYRSKIAAHIDREIASHPEYVQIETSWRSREEKRPNALERGEYEILDTPENPDAERPCPSTRTALIVYGKQVGTTVSVCTNEDCPVHNPSEEKPEPVSTQGPVAIAQPQETSELIDEETEEEKQRQQEEHARERQEQERLAEERRVAFERQQQEYEAEEARRAELQTHRTAIFERILENTPRSLSPGQWRAFLRALIHVDPYTFTDDVAAALVGDDENNQQSAEEVLVSALDGTADDRLPAFALRLALTGHTPLPHEGETDFLKEAEAAFVHLESKETPNKKQRKPPAVKAAKQQKAKTKSCSVNSKSRDGSQKREHSCSRFCFPCRPDAPGLSKDANLTVVYEEDCFPHVPDSEITACRFPQSANVATSCAAASPCAPASEYSTCRTLPLRSTRTTNPSCSSSRRCWTSILVEALGKAFRSCPSRAGPCSKRTRIPGFHLPWMRLIADWTGETTRLSKSL